MEIGQIISGYQSELGVTLHTIKSLDNETTEIEVTLYAPEHQDFAWALTQLSSIEEA